MSNSDCEHKPVRRIRSNYRSVTGIYYSSFGPIEFESQLERDAYTILEFDSSVKGLFPQSIRIGNYVPDCQIHVHAGTKLLAEIKYERELHQNWSGLSQKFARAEDYASNCGEVFGFITDKSVYSNRNLIQILKWMKFTACRNTRNPLIQEKITGIMEDRKRMVFTELVQVIDSNAEDAISSICQSVLSKTLLIAATPTIQPKDCTIVSASTQSIPIIPTIFLPYRAFLKRRECAEPYVE